MKLVQWCLIVLLFSISMLAQVAPEKTPANPQSKTAAATTVAKTHAATPTQLPADAAVITIPKLCASAANGADCKTVITRAEFESLANALSTNKPGSIPEGMRGRVATQYGELLAMANEAEKRGLDKDHATQLLLQFARLQVLATSLLRSIEEQARPTPSEIQKYYDEHLSEYEGIAVQRIIIPASHATKKQGAEKPEALAEQMQKRFVAGEAAAKLQQEVYDKLGLKNPPSTAFVIRPSDLGAAEEPITKMKPGEISQPIDDSMALVIYKSEGSKPLPFDMVKADIEGMLGQQKVKAAFDAFLSDKQAELNSEYFTPNELRRAQKKQNPHDQ